MSIDMVKDIVSILVGIVTIILGVRQFAPKPTTNSQSVNILFNLMVAIGILVIIFGAVNYSSVYNYLSNERKSCLNVDSYALSKTCSERVDKQYNKDIKPSLGYIGSGFVLIALAFLVRNFKTATWIEYVIEFGILIMGFLLIRPNF